MHKLERFFDYAIQERYNLCINGDGIDITQSSWSQLSREVPVALQKIVKMRSLGLKVYYVIGNHDIILENFLQDWKYFELLPFINLTSNDKRIRIEHGHIYDSRYIRSAALFNWVEVFGGKVLRFTPFIFHFYQWLETKAYGMDVYGTGGILGERSSFLRAVTELTQRGFDAVVLGHTHHAGVVELDDNKLYINPGSWIHDTNFIQILNGDIELLDFSKLSKTVL